MYQIICPQNVYNNDGTNIIVTMSMQMKIRL